MSRRLAAVDLHSAARRGDVATVRACLEAGIPVDSEDMFGATALHYASQVGKADAVNLLLDRGASVDAQNEDGRTPLMWVSYNGHHNIVTVLLNHGASVNLQDRSGETPLMLASYCGRHNVVTVVLNHGASVDLQDQDGDTALIDACRQSHEESAQLLLNANADVNIRNKNGETAVTVSSGKLKEIIHAHVAAQQSRSKDTPRGKGGSSHMAAPSERPEARPQPNKPQQHRLQQIQLPHESQVLLESAQAEIERLQNQVRRQTEQLEAKDHQIRREQQTSQQLRRDKDQLQEQVQLQQMQTNTLQQQVDAMHREIHSNRRENTQLQQQLDAAQQRIQETGQALLHTQQQHQLLQQENLQLRQQLRITETQLQARIQHSHLTEFWEVPREDVTLNMQRFLGTGAWGFVVEGQFRGQKVAVKCLHDLIRQPAFIRVIRQEIGIMAQLRHPNLVMLIAAVIGEEEDPLIITELLDTSLRRAYERGRLEGSSKLSIFRDIASALNYLHLHHHGPIIHRDVSSANVLLEAKPNNQWKAKLSDFGSAKLVREAMTTAPGAVVYSAPEVRTQTGIPQSSKVDVYSYGVLMCEVTVNEFPSEERFPSMVRTTSERWPLIHTLITACIQQHPSNRPHMAYILGELGRVFQH